MKSGIRKTLDYTSACLRNLLSPSDPDGESLTAQQKSVMIMNRGEYR